MPLKKQERKERFAEILKLMLNEKHEAAYTKLAVMCGEDTGLFFLCDYDKTVLAARAKREEQANG
jgi:hypothetical protein